MNPNPSEYKTRPAMWIAELERELSSRKSLYPRLIKNQELSRKKANQQFVALNDALKYLKKQFPEPVQEEPTTGNLFNNES